MATDAAIRPSCIRVANNKSCSLTVPLSRSASLAATPGALRSTSPTPGRMVNFDFAALSFSAAFPTLFPAALVSAVAVEL